MKSFMDHFRTYKRRKDERNTPRWGLAQNAVTNRMPLNGSPEEFKRPDNCPQYVVMRRHMYKPNSPAVQVSEAVANLHLAVSLRDSLRRKEEQKKFPVHVYRVQRA